MTFQAWKMKFLNFMTFQVFHDLYEPYFFMGIKYAKWGTFLTKVNLLVPQSIIHVHCAMYIGYSRKIHTPNDGRHDFLTPTSTWISKTAWAPLHLGFPRFKDPPPIWISIKLLGTMILLYTQCGRILLGT